MRIVSSTLFYCSYKEMFVFTLLKCVLTASVGQIEQRYSSKPKQILTDDKHQKFKVVKEIILCQKTSISIYNFTTFIK